MTFTIRTRYGKLKNLKSGQGTQELTERDEMVMGLFRFLDTHIGRRKSKHSAQVRIFREIHPLDLQPHRHSMLVPRVCAPRVKRSSLGKYWSHDSERGWQAANPGVHR